MENLYYRIFDVNKPIMSDYKEYQTDTAKKAVIKYLAEIGEHDKKIKSSGSNFVRIKAEPFIFKEGQRYYTNKRSIWFEVN